MKPTPPEADSGSSFRFKILLALIVCGWGVLLFRTYSLAVLHQAEYLRQGERAARLRYPLPAPRGRILDRDGVPLAWNERSWALYRTGNSPLSEELLQELEVILERRPAASGDSCLAEQLKPGQILILNHLIHNGAPLQVVPRLKRMLVENPRIKQIIGTVEERDGEFFGISGLEAGHDKTLRGTPGEFTVIVDRNRDWVPASWKLERASVPGKDVTIPQSLAELKEGR